MKKCIFLARVGLSILSVFLGVGMYAQGKEGSAGILYGEDHAFAFEAPKGWVLDTRSGVDQGLQAVLYPVGQTWQGSPVMAYPRARTRTGKVKTADQAVHSTLSEFRTNGSPHSKAIKMALIKIDVGRTAQVYYYTGDKWGNYEAAAYIEEPKTINFFIMSAKNKQIFEKSLPAYRSLVKSYIYLGDNPLAAQKQAEANKKHAKP